jgi:hypothetical protein
LSEHDLTDVDGHGAGRVYGLRETRTAGGKAARAFLAIAIKLQMREMQRKAFRSSNSGQRGLDIASHAQIVAMNVQPMGQLQFVHRPLKRFHNGA